MSDMNSCTVVLKSADCVQENQNGNMGYNF